jgi:WhiB family transcriptional regulator, redox-sensing transcriptional regulator
VCSHLDAGGVLVDRQARETNHKEAGAEDRAVRPAVIEEWNRMDWRHHAACREVDPELFFPIGNTGPALLQIEEAKRVCRRCPVMDACLQWAVTSGQDAGVWGGMSEDERRAYKRRLGRVRAHA